MREGADVAIIAYGVMVSRALAAADRCSRGRFGAGRQHGLHRAARRGGDPRGGGRRADRRLVERLDATTC